MYTAGSIVEDPDDIDEDESIEKKPARIKSKPRSKCVLAAVLAYSLYFGCSTFKNAVPSSLSDVQPSGIVGMLFHGGVCVCIWLSVYLVYSVHAWH